MKGIVIDQLNVPYLSNWLLVYGSRLVGEYLWLPQKSLPLQEKDWELLKQQLSIGGYP